MKKLMKRVRELKKEEGGQAIVLVAAALVVLIGFTGLAIDLGFVWFRQAQLKSIVDSAALAGAPQLGPTAAEGGREEADKNAIQYLATNQLLDTDDGVPLDQLTSFESSTGISPLGAREYTITVTWDIPLYFMPVLGFDVWTMTESSTAAYFPLVDLYAGRRVSQSGITTSTQAIFGPNQVTRFGDAFSGFDNDAAQNRQDRGVTREYRYRIEVPIGYEGTVIDNVTKQPLATNIVRVELLDPDSTNNVVPAGATLAHSKKFGNLLLNDGATPLDLIRPVDESDCSHTNQLHNPCIIRTCEWDEQAGNGRCGGNPYANFYARNTNPFDVDQVNPFWFYRLDELRRRGGDSIAPADQTITLYTLYYFQLDANGTVVRQNIASYAGQSQDGATLQTFGVPPIGAFHADTDLKWVSPGAYNDIGFVPTTCNTQSMPKSNGGFIVPGWGGCAATVPVDETDIPTVPQDPATMGRGFEIDMRTDVPGIIEDQINRTVYLYLDIVTMAGASENGYEVWAGPPHAHYGFKSGVNERNLQMTDEGNTFSTDGVSVYSLGILPLNSMTDNRVEFPLVFVSPEYAGRQIEISLFDADSGTTYPLCFYFDTLPNPECRPGFDTSLNGYMVYYDEGNDNFEGQERCFPRCNDEFVDPPFFVTVPDFTEDCDTTAPFAERMLVCNSFLGGRLMVSYEGGAVDTYQWLVSFPSVPYIKE